ncbi:hypothetical protein GPECTOR_31g291 [Gonium pectorale]|uniref:cellulase n=1 Tax=Gonium pectorale TaxID=33097 RepID=A0A150GDM1_GONPE|nr:hypothetical protein GPECTOR_31g291 [Gonium pectorale]|eukprot:KXZ47929.1 hypothetical protein GPECTOR_31g291 [Gonium pectorale]
MGGRGRAGTAFLALSAVSGPAGEAAFGSTTAKSLRCAAKTQVKYLLGANPGKQAFVTGLDIIDGFDTSIAVPQNPRHRAASCKGEVCYGLGENNPHKLLGALVGGPKPDGSYTDSRIAEPDNLVSLEFNGPFTGAVAGLTAIEDTLSCSA